MRILYILFFITFTSLAQDFSAVKAKTDNYPGLLTAEKLASLIEKDFTKEEDKVKAVFCWLTSNIRYDLEEYYKPTSAKTTRFRYRTEAERQQKLQAIRDNIVKETLTGRKAVCEGFAQTFSKVCTLLKIENEIIEGYVRASSNRIGRPLESPNHSWNAVNLGGKWKYFDATWGAGAEFNGKWVRNFNSYYYDIPKEKYFLTHLPEKSLWRLRVGRMDKQQFYEQPIFLNKYLHSDVELVAPKKGTLVRDIEGNIEVRLKNGFDKEYFFGFPGSNIAQAPEVDIERGITKVKIAAPAQAKYCFLLINREIAIEFLVK